MIIKDENSTLRFDRKESEIYKLETATGRNFREMFRYIQTCESNYDRYFNFVKDSMETRLKIYTDQAVEKDLNEFQQNLDILFGLKFYTKLATFRGVFYDRGLIYKEKTWWRN